MRAEVEDNATGRAQDAIRATLEAAGVIFIPENGEGAGVRLSKLESA